MFQNLRTSNQIYILHKDGTPFIETGAVVSVSAPHPKYPVAPQLGQLPQMETVVDLTVSVNGQNTNLQGLPAGADIADFGINGNIVVSCSKEAMNNEVATMRQKSLDIIGSVDFHRSIVAACDGMLDKLNPELLAKQKQDKEIADLRKQVSDMSKGMNDLMKMMQQIVGAGTQGQTSKTK